MTTLEKALNARLLRVANRVKAEQASGGIKASGESAKSLEVEVKENSGTLSGRGYFEFQEFGRGPTTGGRSTPTLQQQIREWLDYKSWSKGFDADKKEGLSWAISTNIHKRGTLRGRTAKYPGLPLRKIFTEEVNGLNLELGPVVAQLAGSEIGRIWKELRKK